MKIEFEKSFELLTQKEWNQYLGEERIDSMMIDKDIFEKFKDRIMMYPILLEEVDALNRDRFKFCVNSKN